MDARTLGRIYVAVVQTVMLYGSEMWVMKPCIGKVLGIFRHRVAHRLTVRQPWRGWYGRWVYPLLEDAMAESGFQEGDTYVYCCQNTVAQFIATRPIMDLCLAAAQRPVSRVSKWWWEQDGLDLEGMRTAAWEERMEGG